MNKQHHIASAGQPAQDPIQQPARKEEPAAAASQPAAPANQNTTIQAYAHLRAEITEATAKLLRGESHGHAGKYGYYNGGAALFSQFIQNNRDYPLYWAEKKLLERRGGTIAFDADDTERVVIVGQGSALRDKEWHIIKHLPHLKQIDFIDLSQKFNDMAMADIEILKSALPEDIKIQSHTIDYKALAQNNLAAINPDNLITTVICTGGLITNQDAPANGKYPEAAVKDDLRSMARLTGGNGHLILSYDTNDEIHKLKRAYGTEDLKDFYYNCLEFMFTHSSGIELKDAAGNHIDPDKASLHKIFEFATVDRFDQQVRNYPHMMRTTVPFFAYIDKGDETETVSVEAGTEFVMMNCYKPRQNRMVTLAEESAYGSREFSIESGTGYTEDGIMVQVFDVKPRDSQPVLPYVKSQLG